MTARVIAGIAAGAAALSMLVAYLTYRRLRPRVVIKLEHIHVLQGALTADGKPQVIVKMRLINRSASAARIEVFRLWLRFDTGGATYPGGLKKGDRSLGRRELEDPLVIGPMDGVKFEAVFDKRNLNLFSFPVDSGKIDAVLSDGRTIRRKLDDAGITSLRVGYSREQG